MSKDEMIRRKRNARQLSRQADGAGGGQCAAHPPERRGQGRHQRVLGRDVNPYLALAATLACGYFGMIEDLPATQDAEGSAYDTREFGLHRHISAAIDSFRSSDAMRSMLGEEFVDLYCKLKEDEYLEFEEIITPRECEVLMFNV